MNADPGIAMARLLVQAGAIQFSRERPFLLAAGWASPAYVDCRRLIGMPAWRRAAVELLLGGLQDVAPFDWVAGGETAGIPWASWVAERLDRPLLYVRKRPLGIGRHAQVEGGEVRGQRVLLIDDLATDAGSKAAFVRGLRIAGATVTDSMVLFYHRAFASGTERLAQLELRLHSVADWNDVLRLDAAERCLDPSDRARLASFLADPVAWSAAHDGRGRRATRSSPPPGL
jgi:orotate phosphoribosyltransferase